MRYPHIHRADLNLLLSFQALFEEHSVTRAAERVFLSQPAMSRAFHRLQELFHDELLIWTPKGYEPTRRARTLYATLNRILPELEILFHGQEFKARNSTDSFRIGASSYATFWLVASISRSFVTEAPSARLKVTPWTGEFGALASNELELILAGMKPQSELRSEVLVRDPYVCLVRLGHPLTKHKLTLRRYLAFEHIAGSSLVEKTLNDLGKERKVRLEMPLAGSVESVVAETDLVATVTMRYAQHAIDSSPTQIISAPRAISPLIYYQIWHPRNDSDPAHRWLRSLVRASVRAIK